MSEAEVKKCILALEIGWDRNVKAGKREPHHVLLVSMRVASHKSPVEEESRWPLPPNSADICTFFVNVFQFILCLKKDLNWLPVQDGGVDRCVLIYSCERTKITTSCWTIDRRTLELTKKRYPTSKDKEAVARWQEGHNLDKIKSHTGSVGDPQTGEQSYQRS